MTGQGRVQICMSSAAPYSLILYVLGVSAEMLRCCKDAKMLRCYIYEVEMSTEVSLLTS